MKIDIKKSLQEIEGTDWGEPIFESSLVTECHRLRRIPLCEFTSEDLRRMIGQNISLELLIPLAIERLINDPLLEATFYPGDLLVAVLRANHCFWDSQPDMRARVSELGLRAFSKLETLDTIDRKTTEDELKEASHVFNQFV